VNLPSAWGAPPWRVVALRATLPRMPGASRSLAPKAAGLRLVLGARAWGGARAIIGALAVLGALGASGIADAQSVELHEFIPLDPKEDLRFSATTIDGGLPAAIDTPSGVATAPDLSAPPPDRTVLRRDPAPDKYVPDRDTSKPSLSLHGDPFSPSIAPFQRLHAYDTVSNDLSLGVRRPALVAVPVGEALRPGDESFYADLSLEVGSQPVRIPTVGPGTRVMRAVATPPVSFTIVADGAENHFVRSTDTGPVRLVLQLAIARASFGAAFVAHPGWQLPAADRPPAALAPAYERVASAMGLRRSDPPAEALEKLVGYFRSFVASPDMPTGESNIYLDLALSKKGVCRHRSYAFFVTALYYGFQVRMVTSDVHAWVEVFDGQIWHRIDLGGAADVVEDNTPTDRPAHSPPPDPYEWPANQAGAQDVIDRRRAQGSTGSNSTGGASSAASGMSSAAPSGSVPSPPAASSTLPPAPSGASAPAYPSPGSPGALTGTEVRLRALGRDARRGAPLRIQGDASTDGTPCAHLRVDVWLRSPRTPAPASAGSLTTNERGELDGTVVVPVDLPLGDYEILLTTPGDTRCGASAPR
jgi:hypothetical protein